MGWVNGERVDLEVSANYFPGVKPFYGGRMIISGQRGFYTVDEITAAAEGRSKIDLRYGTKYKEEHDQQGRIVSRVRRTNNGNFLTTQKFEYGDGSKTIRTFDESNKFFGHTLEKVDEVGNVVAEQSLSESGAVLDSRRYEYKFDQQGNWIERREFGRQVGRTRTERLLRTLFREITYYPELIEKHVALSSQKSILQRPQDNRSIR